MKLGPLCKRDSGNMMALGKIENGLTSDFKAGFRMHGS